MPATAEERPADKDAGLLERIGNLERRTNQNFIGMDTVLSKLREDVGVLRAGVKPGTEAPAGGSDLADRLAKLDHRMNENFVSIDSILEKLNDRIDRIGVDLEGIEKKPVAVSPHPDIAENLARRIDSLENSFKNWKGENASEKHGLPGRIPSDSLSQIKGQQRCTV